MYRLLQHYIPPPTQHYTYIFSKATIMNACTNTRTYLSVSLSFPPKEKHRQRRVCCLPGPDRFSRTTWIFFSCCTYYIQFDYLLQILLYCACFITLATKSNIVLCVVTCMVGVCAKVYVCATAVLHIWRVRFVMDEYSLSCHCIIIVSFIY